MLRLKGRQAEAFEREHGAPKKVSAKKLAVTTLAEQFRMYGLPAVDHEHYFALSIGRKWRFDFAFPAYHIAVEVEGLVMERVTVLLKGGGTETRMYVSGRHASPKGIYEDMDKYNWAAILGWRLIRIGQKNVFNQKGVAPCSPLCNTLATAALG